MRVSCLSLLAFRCSLFWDSLIPECAFPARVAIFGTADVTVAGRIDCARRLKTCHV